MAGKRFDGTPGNDTYYGGDGNDEIFGGAGNDKLYGNAGDDWMDGGEGCDEVHGGDGNDHSSVVAPSPHGLAGTFSPALRVRQTMKKNSSVEAVVMKAPMDET